MLLTIQHGTTVTEQKYYYMVSQSIPRIKKATLVLATNRNTAKHAWRYIHNCPGSGLRAVKFNDTPSVQGISNRANRHAEVLDGEWNE